MSEKYKKRCKYLQYVKNLLILSLTITGLAITVTIASQCMHLLHMLVLLYVLGTLLLE